MEIQPLGNRVVIKPFEDEVEHAGIIIPATAKENSMKGIIEAMGPVDEEFAKMQLKVGDKVLYNKFVGTEISYQDDDLLIMKISEILAVFK